MYVCTILHRSVFEHTAQKCLNLYKLSHIAQSTRILHAQIEHNVVLRVVS